MKGTLECYKCGKKKFGALGVIDTIHQINYVGDKMVSATCDDCEGVTEFA